MTKAERIVRKKGAFVNIRFRRYERWGLFPIKAYGPGLDENPPDFRSWEEADAWVTGKLSDAWKETAEEGVRITSGPWGLE